MNNQEQEKQKTLISHAGLCLIYISLGGIVSSAVINPEAAPVIIKTAAYGLIALGSIALFRDIINSIQRRLSPSSSDKPGGESLHQSN